jgi:SAM-dependent methyltransferase
MSSPDSTATLEILTGNPCDGPCGKPCADEADCEEGCAEAGATTHAPLTRMLFQTFVNALDVCFDEVLKEPKKILIIGGCRQRDFAQYIALLLLGSDITLLDPDPRQAQRAREEICCRFKFLSGAVEQMPFENGEFDLVFAHNLPEFSLDLDAAVAEIARITTRDRGNFMITHHRPLLWQWARYFPGMRHALRQMGISVPEDRIPTISRLPGLISRSAAIGTRLSPLPWQMYMTRAITA